jgi:hypothetical protein
MFHVKPLFSIHSLILFIFLFLFTTIHYGQGIDSGNDKFRQLDQLLPTPNTYRNASGAPGVDYWKQKVDYDIQIELDENKHTITGTEVIIYHNNSPDDLQYLWLQLDQNMRAKDSDTHHVRTSKLDEKSSIDGLEYLKPSFDGGFKIQRVSDTDNNNLPYTINKTMMRIDLPTVLKSGDSYSFELNWYYNINNRLEVGGRSGYEFFEKENNALYTIAQFFPRLCVYNDVDGWQNKQFLGRGEFTLEFGDYEVEITVPSDHLVAATGVLMNEEEVLTKSQRDLFKKARQEYEQPVIIHSQKTAEKIEKGRAIDTKTWKFKADNVRDFAFASSRKFIWDAMAVKQSDGSIVMAMSMYPKEGNPLWEQYSTKAVAHTIKWYSHYTFDYPYPVAWSINADRIGMEYPMICFNFGRTEEDGTYDKRTKYGMIGVIIHEVGHNYFPMIVNSDERQWTWMDEGLNSFVQYLAECQWERDYPHRRGPAYKITDYMKGDKAYISPIMTNSESIHQFGNNAYGKPATALNILRETVMGRELFDMSFKTYARRWMFKQPTPSDFFRTMEDASGVDLDWFWRGWFYTTDNVEQELVNVNEKVFDDGNPVIKNEKGQEVRDQKNNYISNIRNRKEIQKTYDEIDPSIRDFYSTYDEYATTQKDIKKYEKFKEELDEKEKQFLKANPYYYELTLKNNGGLVMPVILQFNYEDGTDEIIRIPAEIWRFNPNEITKVFPSSKRVKQIILDPFLETADVDTSNNYYPKQQQAPSRFEVFKHKQEKQSNPMQEAKQKVRS